MMVPRNTPAVRPEQALDRLGPRFGEYPARLWTRRACAGEAEVVIDRRESAPNCVWRDPRARPEAWDPALR